MNAWFSTFVKMLPAFWQGAWVTLQLTAVGLLMGMVLGLLAALGRIYGNKWVRALAVAYIELFRGTPALVQLFFGVLRLARFGHYPVAYAFGIFSLGLEQWRISGRVFARCHSSSRRRANDCRARDWHVALADHSSHYFAASPADCHPCLGQRTNLPA